MNVAGKFKLESKETHKGSIIFSLFKKKSDSVNSFDALSQLTRPLSTVGFKLEGGGGGSDGLCNVVRSYT